MDRICIEHLAVNAFIGMFPHERTKRQKLVVDTVLSGDFRAAGRTGDFSKTVDYSAVEEKIKDFVEHSTFLLLEVMAEHLADTLLADPLIQSVQLRISKPGAPRFAQNIALEIERP